MKRDAASSRAAGDDDGRGKRLRAGTPVMIGAASDPGKKHVHEDRYVVDDGGDVVGVFDGHAGAWVADYLREHAAPCIREQVARQEEPKPALQSAFQQLDDQILKQCPDESGACAVVSLIAGNVVWSANVGDCRAVLARRASPDAPSYRAVPLTKDHAPIYAAEATRIRAAGGFVEDGRVNGRLEVSRSFGDRAFKRVGVISAPYVSHFQVRPTDGFLVQACDGLWKVMDAQAVVDFIAARLDDPDLDGHHDNDDNGNVARVIARLLLTHCVVDLHAKDNVTIVIVLLNR
ncbi:unnamed protein product (mitochondrion) [Plasmodiophora brassicae]|uniref:PPM-type phosphatase domain-containing protein n=1 Tax=Plasmodiophora brassicae TaxID=37360 RepID=A0A3P3YAB3_PLABS|nr:unnamed protein product [Plasmodiophora brassicae]